MEFEILWWQWIVGGIGLVIIEIFLPSFISMWFGLGAIIVGLLAWAFPQMGVSAEILVWIISSGIFVLIWFKYFKPKMVDKTKAGVSRDAAIGERGHVIKAPVDGGRGVVRFNLPVLSEDEWPFICEGSVAAGDKVAIKDFSGNTLVVEKLNT
ncbi:MAG: NfeD family protein [Porticoccaceae bacterium]|nr:NfeD family protein [Porticoccaceae bacterium]